MRLRRVLGLLQVAVVVSAATVVGAEETRPAFTPPEQPLARWELRVAPPKTTTEETKQPRGALYELVDQQDGRVVMTGHRADCVRRRLAEAMAVFGTGNVNWPFPTMGGKQFWADECVLDGWRIQRGVFTDHYRLLDDRDVRRAWGSYAACRVVLEEKRLARNLAYPEHVVVLLHGLIRSKDCLKKLEADLQDVGYATLAINYPSTRGSLDDHAAQVARVLARLQGVRRVSFVTHSLGGLVLRKLVGEGWLKLPVQRIVMLAPPNQGSKIAELFDNQSWFRELLGAAAASATESGTADLAVPTCEFAVIAGGTGTIVGKNPLLPGDNDGLLRVETTRLEGGHFLRVNSRHRRILDDPRARGAAVHFLKAGKLGDAEAREVEANGAEAARF